VGGRGHRAWRVVVLSPRRRRLSFASGDVGASATFTCCRGDDGLVAAVLSRIPTLAVQSARVRPGRAWSLPCSQAKPWLWHWTVKIRQAIAESSRAWRSRRNLGKGKTEWWCTWGPA
jgi:hypothetical protein